MKLFKNAKAYKMFLRKHKSENGYTNSQINGIVLLMFPVKDADFNVYVNAVQGYLTPAAQLRLKIDPLKFAVFAGLMGGPAIPTGTPPGTNSTPHTFNYVYPLEKSSATFTHPLKDEKVLLEEQLKVAIRNLWTDVPDSVITITDTTVLHLVPKASHADPTPEPEKIDVLVKISLDPVGGGNVWCDFNKMTGGAGKLNENVQIEIAYSLIPINATPPVPSPATSAQCTNHLTVSTSHFLLELGELAMGMKLVLFARWVYVKHPKQSGAYGVSVSTPVY